MKNTVFLLLLLLIACDKKDSVSPADNYDIVQDCREQGITDSLAIIDNIQGSWTLIGYNCGFCPAPDLPEAHVQFAKGTGRLTYRHSPADTIEAFDFVWHLEKYSGSGEQNSVYTIVTDPYHKALSCEVFCDDHIFYDHSPWDGLMYLYEED